MTEQIRTLPNHYMEHSAHSSVVQYTLSQSHHCCFSSETAVPITVERDNKSSTNGEIFNRVPCCCLQGAEQHGLNAARHSRFTAILMFKEILPNKFRSCDDVAGFIQYRDLNNKLT